jgi:hypothetical protein
VIDDDAAALAAIAAALAILAARRADPPPAPSRWRLAGRPSAGDALPAPSGGSATRWASAGRRG